MIDFHSHILPGVDDGAKTIEDSIQLINEAQEAGFKGIISTAHYLKGHYETTKKEREALLKEVQKEAKEGVKLYLGNEIYITEDIPELIKTNKACTINKTKYILFELPFNQKPINTLNIIMDIINHGYTPILAHPERYSFVQKEPNLVYDLINRGCLIQCNYGSIVGIYGNNAKIIVKNLLINNLVHFLGSDVHKPETIYPRMSEILDKLTKIMGEGNLEQITTINPTKLLANEKINILEPKQIKLSLKDRIKLHT